MRGALVGGRRDQRSIGDFVVGGGDGLEHGPCRLFDWRRRAELEGFVLAVKRGRDGGRGKRSSHRDDVGFDRRIAPGIDDLAGVDL